MEARQSLRARLGLNLSKVNAAEAQSEVAAASRPAVHVERRQRADFGPATTSTKSVRQSEGRPRTRDKRPVQRDVIDTLKHSGDPRLAVWAPVQDPNCRTVANCTPVAAGATAVCRTGCWRVTPARGARVVGAWRGGFAATRQIVHHDLRRVLVHKGGSRGRLITGSAATFYQDGIRASMQQWGVADADITTTRAAVRRIQERRGRSRADRRQKWIALFTRAGRGRVAPDGLPDLTAASNAKTSNSAIRGA